ncbi:hypothetical protein TNIN_58971 [Trichonephila inaurata madagascariensis]|uniref:Uncharacterized protein n=1 Tax=Trichonephila inaurata madagascariensis TaxID=2747483 RepID=A0A8X6X4T5_9ARAC|nr:hypothetical protein TNIN_58971 [Trichonephila inaurata madagascariensis]
MKFNYRSVAGLLEETPYHFLLIKKRNALEFDPGNIVTIQFSPIPRSNDAGIPNPGIDGPTKNNATGPCPVERTIPFSQAVLAVVKPQLRSSYPYV